ncbi:MAG: radical SAM protein [Methanobrevibacter sp.]|nr:radical SAM protein [Methanobrevibacter sp.]
MHGNYTCNLNCIYCEHNKLRDNYYTKIMSEDIARMTIEKLGPMMRELTWHGGEPTLLPDSLIQLVEEIKHKNNFDFKTTLQTNSVALTPEKIQLYKDLNINWGTSFDGIDNDHNRGVMSTKKILELSKTIDNFPGFITVYTKETAHHMIENYEYYKSIGIKCF